MAGQIKLWWAVIVSLIKWETLYRQWFLSISTLSPWDQCLFIYHRPFHRTEKYSLGLSYCILCVLLHIKYCTCYLQNLLLQWVTSIYWNNIFSVVDILSLSLRVFLFKFCQCCLFLYTYSTNIKDLSALCEFGQSLHDLCLYTLESIYFIFYISDKID